MGDVQRRRAQARPLAYQDPIGARATQRRGQRLGAQGALRFVEDQRKYGQPGSVRAASRLGQREQRGGSGGAISAVDIDDEVRQSRTSREGPFLSCARRAGAVHSHLIASHDWLIDESRGITWNQTTVSERVSDASRTIVWMNSAR